MQALTGEVSHLTSSGGSQIDFMILCHCMKPFAIEDHIQHHAHSENIASLHFLIASLSFDFLSITTIIVFLLQRVLTTSSL